MQENKKLPSHFAQRIDETDDALFYASPRLVAHIDEATIEALSDVYREFLPRGSDILDSMSSWISHLPREIDYGRVTGLGMNQDELSANPRLTETLVHDLNTNPRLPFGDESFDFVLNAVSIQYLTHPIEVFCSVARVLRPGGLFLVAVSHRVFPTKAIQIWQSLAPVERPRLVETYFEKSGSFANWKTLDRSPAGADPLWVVIGRKE